MRVYLCTTFEVSIITLTSFREGVIIKFSFGLYSIENVWNVRNVMTSFRILSSFECFYVITFFTLQCEMFTNCNVSARTGRVGLANQMWTGLDRETGWGAPKIPKFVRTSFMDDPKESTKEL